MTDMASAPSPGISSPANPQLKAARALRDRRERDRLGRTIVDGAREVRRALEAGVVVEAAFVCDGLLAGPDARAVLDGLDRAGVRPLRLTERAFGSVAFGDRWDGIVAVVRTPATGLDQLRLPADPLVVVLEGIEKPGNLGAVLRTADGAGVDAVIAAAPRTDLFNPNVIRASAGTAFGVPLAAGPTAEVVDRLRDDGIRIVATRVGASRRYWDADLRGPVAIVLGSEADGLTDAWTGPGIEAIGIPMAGIADSLNVSVAAAVLLYEARRQRDAPPSDTP